MNDEISQVRIALSDLSQGVRDSRHDDVRWGDAWAATIGRINVGQVTKACLAVMHGGSASKSEIDEAKLCLHLARGGHAFAKRIREIWDDNCYKNPKGENIENLWVKLYGYHRGQFPQLEIRL